MRRFVRYYSVTVTSNQYLKFIAFWDIAPYRVVEVDRRFRDA
jgi:hypothetical protein